MKTNLKLLYDPFSRIAGWRAFFAGLPIVCATVLLGWLAGAYAFGLEIKTGFELTLPRAFAYTGIGLACYVAVMYIVGLIFSRGVRFQDILGTVTLARAPYIFSPLLGLVADPRLSSQIKEMSLDGNPGVINWFSLVLIAILAIATSVWAVAMLYYAFRTSTGMKGAKCAWLFILSLIASEAAMLVILSYI